MNIAIIPARGGSKRIPRKNIREFHGKPIIAYSIETAKKSGLFKSVIVTTDDLEIASIATDCGADSIHIRDPDQADDVTGTQEVIGQVLKDIVNYENPRYVCGIYATSPLMSALDIQRGFMRLNTSDCDYAFSIGVTPKLHDAGQFYFGTRNAFIEGRPLFSSKTIMIPISEQRDCDINLEEDWQRAEEMYIKLGGESWDNKNNSGVVRLVTNTTNETPDS